MTICKFSVIMPSVEGESLLLIKIERVGKLIFHKFSPLQEYINLIIDTEVVNYVCKFIVIIIKLNTQ